MCFYIVNNLLLFALILFLILRIKFLISKQKQDIKYYESQLSSVILRAEDTIENQIMQFNKTVLAPSDLNNILKEIKDLKEIGKISLESSNVLYSLISRFLELEKENRKIRQDQEKIFKEIERINQALENPLRRFRPREFVRRK